MCSFRSLTVAFILLTWPFAGCGTETLDFAETGSEEGLVDGGKSSSDKATDVDGADRQGSSPSEAPEVDGDESGPDIGLVDPEGNASAPEEEPALAPADLDAGPGPGGNQEVVACSSGDECESQHCVDGVCCATACEGICRTCSAPGREGECSAPAEDADCPSPNCPAETECRRYVAPAGNSCLDLGTCRTEWECEVTNIVPGQSCGAGAGQCDGAGECVIPDKAGLGESCLENDDCGESNCVQTPDGLRCCDAACDGICEACGTDGRCNTAPSDDSRCPVLQCPAESACSEYPQELSRNRCVAFGNCEHTQNHCQVQHKAQGVACGSGLECDGGGNCLSVCSGAQVWCDSQCIDPDSNNNHCGVDSACTGGASCTGEFTCEQGQCQIQCGSGLVRCSGTCINPESDNTYCGASGACSASQAGSQCTAATETCIQGSCKRWRGHQDLMEGINGVPTLVVADNGDTHALWQMRNGSEPDLSVFYARYAANNEDWGSPELVEKEPGFVSGLQLQVNDSGDAVAAWHQDSQNATGDPRIRTSYRAAGGSWTGYQELSANDLRAISPKLVQLSNGDMLSTWTQRAGVSGVDSVAYARRIASGWLQTSALESSSEPAQSQELAADTSGGAMALWSTPDTLYANHWTGSGWGAASTLSSGGEFRLYHNVRPDDAGNYYAAWMKHTAGGTDSVEVRRFQRSSGTWETTKTFANGGPFVRLAVTPNGTPYVSWWTGSGTIWTRLDPQVNDWLSPQPLGEDNSGFMLTDDSNNVYAFWQQDSNVWWRYLPDGAAQFSIPEEIMDFDRSVFSYDVVIGPEGRGMATYSHGPGDGTSEVGFNRLF